MNQNTAHPEPTIAKLSPEGPFRLGHVACVITSVIAAMYSATLLLAISQPITLTGMLDIRAPSAIIGFKLAYTLALWTTVIAYLVNYRVLTIATSLAICLLTSVALLRSVLLDYRPSFYEWYVGEILTLVVAMTLLATALRFPKPQELAQSKP